MSLSSKILIETTLAFYLKCTKSEENKRLEIAFLTQNTEGFWKQLIQGQEKSH